MLHGDAAPPAPRRPRKKRIRGIDGAERLDMTQVERLVGNCRRTVERWILTKGFPAPRYLGRKRLWLVSEVRAWIAENERSGATPAEDPA
jgi:predicted DNA-binding transcriptional regulator AlpA